MLDVRIHSRLPAVLSAVALAKEEGVFAKVGGSRHSMQK
jgi:hypothetical protein